MDNGIAVKVSNLSKSYKLYDNHRDRFKETFHPFRKIYHHDFYALKNISFEINKGDTVGIIGRNGSGKSTLLQIICNAVTPTNGIVEVNGKTSALLEIGSGFNPELSGIENVYFNGTIMGYTIKEIDGKLDDILSFADIGEFACQPVKTYSSGMFVRLAFSAAIMVDPEILIVDEALSVGDIFFQAKCIDRMKRMINDKNVTLLFVSHDMRKVKSICQKTIFLSNGELIDYGESNDIVEKYSATQIKNGQKAIFQDSNNMKQIPEKEDKNLKDEKYNIFKDNSLFKKKAEYQRTQNGKASIINVKLLDENEESVYFVECDQKVILRMAIEIKVDINLLDFGYYISDENGVEIVHSYSMIENKHLYNVKKGDRYIIDMQFKASLGHITGKYTIATGLVIPINYDMEQCDICDRVPISVQFEVMPRKGFPVLGLVHWDNEIEFYKY